MKKIITIVCLGISLGSFSQTIESPIFASGLNTAVEITHAGDSRLFVVELGGSIRIVNADGTVNPTSFLTLPPGIVLSGSERGLLGLAFHPQYATNGFFYICYTRDPDGSVMIMRYSVDPGNPNVALPESAFEIMSIPHPESNHNGGTLRFGPDGYLYVGIGDGWAPLTNAQDINLNLGKLLRIDVNNSTPSQPYAIPPGNPFIGTEGNDEIWALGLRNPWKYSFDRNTGDLWIADVGEVDFEEINHVPSTSAGVNYGWSCYEANNEFTTCGAPSATFTFPVVSYPHAINRCSIIGGYVYTGTEAPSLIGKYVFVDMCSNAILMADVNTGELSSSIALPGGLNYFMTLGEDINGELYVSAPGIGAILKIIEVPLATSSFDSKSALVLMPNPTGNDFYIKSNHLDFPVQVSVIDATGKRLIDTNVATEASAVSIENLKSGVYMVRVTSNSGAVSSSKLAVVK